MVQDILDQIGEGGDFRSLIRIYKSLEALEDDLTEWGQDVSARMLKNVAQDDYNMWLKIGGEISREVKSQLRKTTAGEIFNKLQAEQVDLIKSLPRLASEKVHAMAKEAMENGDRFETVAQQISESWRSLGESRATLIARTETSRARSNFTQARAEAVGSTGYIWHTAGDGRVRETHARLDGTVQRWDSPPVCDYGAGGEEIRSAPGAVFNCRCFAEPLFPKDIFKK